MILSNPVTITPPAITKADKTIKTFNPITLTELDITIIDNSKKKTVLAKVTPCPIPLILWQGVSYTAIGDYTQAQVENKILELLGGDPKTVLEDLFVPSSPTKK